MTRVWHSTDLCGHLMFERELPKDLYHGVPIASSLTRHEGKRKGASNDVALAKTSRSAGHVSARPVSVPMVSVQRRRLTSVSRSTTRLQL